MDITHIIVPGNSAFVVPLDSTRRTIEGTTASVATGSAFLVPGRFRFAWKDAIVTWSCIAATQNVTVLEQILTGAAGAATDWETQGAAGSHTVTAGTTASAEWKPYAADWRILIQAGATGPSAITFRASVKFAGDFGN